ncbi:SNF2-related protein [Psychrosphaera sp. 1_MG-2023]|uniref:SNF2-related protein n=1 Tax=Psychrosphaera sp. 1_MG-2023 TaxID=3062643 RepID=UPI0026E15C4E|nr:SNF2-related protein [Psychrosphaera sp. 1_MG-2023]MDO6718704.1 SNF2-related protein [Psychrosphaera sp. 1_MG-2023]
MAFSNLINRFFKNVDKSISFNFTTDDIDGGYFSLDKSEFEKIRNGTANEWLTQQYVTLKMLEEQGEAESIPNGFIVPSSVLCRLDDYVRESLSLPPLWDGAISADIKGTTSRSNFNVELSVSDPDGRSTHSYVIEGPIIKFGETAQFLLTQAQLIAFEAKKKHDNSAKSEFDNLTLLHNLQLSQKQNAKLQLQHFERLKIHTPEKIAVEAEVDAYGNLILTPFMGQVASHEEMQKVLGQIVAPNANTIKVGDEIILFTEDKIKAVKEVLDNRIVPKSKVKEFLENPTAFIDASLVDLELGFSLRVHGATTFKHAYFGETDDSGVDWFGQADTSEQVLPIAKIASQITDTTSFQQVEKLIDDAKGAGASEIQYEGSFYDISDDNQVKNTLDKIKRLLDGQDPGVGEGEDEEKGGGISEPKPTYMEETLVVDIDLNDEVLTENSPVVSDKIKDVCRVGELDWTNYLRTPYKHQDIGVRWILGLLDQSHQKNSFSGSLLADDMGLGKTFMALSAVEHYYRELNQTNETQKPTLIVAPLSLLENWKDEVDKTFETSPFRDIVILQSDGELNRFRNGGVEIRSNSLDDEEFEPRYSLNIGKNCADRLDMPGRLVITTYQTLRDYQFSLCLVDWGVVIFDEAQNIKNPNALATRAAKGLKAQFKLVATGTPVENSLADFWCLMDTACPEYLGGYQDFRSKYISPILQAASDEVEEIRNRVGRELRIKVGAIMLRRLKEDNLDGLPEKHMYVGIENTDWKYLPELGKTMAGYQLKVYNGAIESVGESESNHVLGTLQRLRSSSLHPRLADGGSLNCPKSNKELNDILFESEKLKSLLALLDLIKTKNEKCIIFAVNKRLQTFLSIALGRKYNLGPLSIINGDAKAVSKNASTPTRKSMIADFEAKVGFNIIVMSPVAAGVGLTVIGANNVVHFERHWNPAKEAQATDRVYRIGQTKDVNIYVPVLLHPKMESFDVNLHKLLTKKTLLKDAVVTPEEVTPMPGGLGGAIGFTDEQLISADDIKKLSWQQFEALTVEVMGKELAADSVWLASNGPDKGSDGVLKVNNELVLIQAKHTIGGRYDGYKAVQEIFSAKPIYQDTIGTSCKTLLFITNATMLSSRTREVAKQCGVDVINGKELAQLVKKHQISFKQILMRLDKKRLKV